jgi:hypothetical protein
LTAFGWLLALVNFLDLDEVRCSVHEQRAVGVIDFLHYLDRRRKEARAAA